MNSTRTTALAASFAAAVVSLAACSGDSDTPTPTAPPTAGASASATSSTTVPTTDTSTSAAPVTSSTSSAAGSGSNAALDDAQVGDTVDAVELGKAMTQALTEGQSGHMTMDMGTITAEGDFEVVEDGVQNTRMTMQMGGQDVEMISVDGVTYMKGMTGLDKWVKTEGPGPGGTPNLSTFDPTRMAKAFDGIDAVVTAKDADSTTYSFEMDVKKLFGATQTDVPTGMTLPDSLPVSYTLDSDNRPMKSTIDLGTTIVVEYSDWGKQVDILAPPASQVITLG